MNQSLARQSGPEALFGPLLLPALKSIEEQADQSALCVRRLSPGITLRGKHLFSLLFSLTAAPRATSTLPPWSISLNVSTIQSPAMQDIKCCITILTWWKHIAQRCNMPGFKEKKKTAAKSESISSTKTSSHQQHIYALKEEQQRKTK